MPIPSMMEFLRMNKIFQPQQSMGTQPVGNDLPPQGGITGNMQTPDMMSPGVPTTHDTNVTDVNDIYRGVYTPEHDAADKLGALIDQFPIHQKPTFMRKLAASLVGASGDLEAANKITDDPFNKQLADWKNKLQPIEASATNERMMNSQERMAAGQITTQNRIERHQEETERQGQEKIDLAEKTATAKQFDAEHPDWKPESLPGQTLKYRNPKDPTQVYDTKIPTEKLGDADKINLQTRGRLSEIAAQGSNQLANTAAAGGEARKTEETRQSGREQVAETRGWKIYTVPDPAHPGQTKGIKINEITGEVKELSQPVTDVHKPGAEPKPAVDINKPLPPTQQRVATVNRANQAMAEHPEWKKYIKVDAHNNVSVTPPSGTGITSMFSSGPTPEMHTEISNYLYGTSAAPNKAGAQQQMAVVDKATNKVIGHVPIGDVDKVDKTKYSVQVP